VREIDCALKGQKLVFSATLQGARLFAIFRQELRPDELQAPSGAPSARTIGLTFFLCKPSLNLKRHLKKPRYAADFVACRKIK